MGHVSNKMKESAGSDGASFVLRSGWNINPKQGIPTEFEKQGWAHLLREIENRNGTDEADGRIRPYWRRDELSDGTSVIRVMTPDMASAQSCVSCHNKLEQTPEVRAMRKEGAVKQFALGELMCSSQYLI